MISLVLHGDFCLYIVFSPHLEGWALSATQSDGFDLNNAIGHEFEQLWEVVKDRKVWHAAVHGVTKSWTWQLNNSKKITSIFEEVSRQHTIFIHMQ